MEGGEELAAIMGALIGKLGEEIFVDPAEHVTPGALQRRVVEDAQHIAKHVVFKALIFGLGQHALKRRIICLHRLHGRNDNRRAIGAAGQAGEMIELSLRLQENGAAAGKVLLLQRPDHAASAGQPRFDFRLHHQVSAIRVAQEDQAHDRQEILIAGKVAISAELVRRRPEALLDGFDIGFHQARMLPKSGGRSSSRLIVGTGLACDPQMTRSQSLPA